ncbi:hypothetical protein CHS0354_035258 [Potamilus streckersoni]|uniref:6,7-dimethyl-8-ribityllumazine synthase n=1 Tax=Potamilus streckersoni TaxID=2493646 RepID=A0AAE0VPA4_9BIVA|nr:hypothetical protein CHS0354_035258 [Potamilus streckersoni]
MFYPIKHNIFHRNDLEKNRYFEAIQFNFVCCRLDAYIRSTCTGKKRKPPPAQEQSAGQPAQEQAENAKPAEEKQSGAASADVSIENGVQSEIKIPVPITGNSMKAYRPSYFLPYTYSPQDYTNDTIRSRRQTAEAKFQLSVIAQMVEYAGYSLHVFYSQRSFWQVLDVKNSRPFRETNYNPGTLLRSADIYKNRDEHIYAEIIIDHMSNGQVEPYSRSQNRYSLAGIYKTDKLYAELRLLNRFKEDDKKYEGDPEGDENPDLYKYQGYHEVHLSYKDGYYLGTVLRYNFAHNYYTWETNLGVLVPGTTTRLLGAVSVFYRLNYYLPVTYSENGYPMDVIPNLKRQNVEAKFQFSAVMYFTDIGDFRLYGFYTQKVFGRNTTLKNQFPSERVYIIRVYYCVRRGIMIFMKFRALTGLVYRDANTNAEARFFARFPESEKTDENPDIEHYQGFSEYIYDYYYDGYYLGGILKGNFITGHMGLELNAGIPWGSPRFSILLQYYNGYLESLTDYNRNIERFGIEGKLSAKDIKIVIVVSRFNEFINQELLNGAVDMYKRLGGEEKDLMIVKVPGAFEIPPVCAKIAEKGQADGILALGTVIKGATAHFDYVAGSAVNGLNRVSADYKVPVGFGVLTTDNIEQAIERAGTKAGNKGAEAMSAVIETVNVIRQIAQTSL